MPPEPPVVQTAWLESHFPKEAQERQQRSPRGPQGRLWKWLSPTIQFLNLRLGPYQSSNFRSLNRAAPNVTASFPGTKPGVWRQNFSCQNKNPLNYLQFTLDLPVLYMFSVHCLSWSWLIKSCFEFCRSWP